MPAGLFALLGESALLVDPIPTHAHLASLHEHEPATAAQDVARLTPRRPQKDSVRARFLHAFASIAQELAQAGLKQGVR